MIDPATKRPGRVDQGPRRPCQAVGRHHGEPPENEARVAVGDRASHPEDAGGQLPDEVVDEVLAERLTAQGGDEECRAHELEEQIAGDEQPRAPVERVGDPDRHEEAGDIKPTRYSRTGSRSGSSQFVPHAVMYHA
jgi:hypothetical protein